MASMTDAVAQAAKVAVKVAAKVVARVNNRVVAEVMRRPLAAPRPPLVAPLVNSAIHLHATGTQIGLGRYHSMSSTTNHALPTFSPIAMRLQSGSIRRGFAQLVPRLYR